MTFPDAERSVGRRVGVRRRSFVSLTLICVTITWPPWTLSFSAWLNQCDSVRHYCPHWFFLGDGDWISCKDTGSLRLHTMSSSTSEFLGVRPVALDKMPREVQGKMPLFSPFPSMPLFHSPECLRLLMRGSAVATSSFLLDLYSAELLVPTFQNLLSGPLLLSLL